MNITPIQDKIKTMSRSHNGETVLVILLIIVCSSISFYLGRNSISTPNMAKTGESEYADYSLADPVEYRPGSLAAAIYNTQESAKIDPNAPNTAQNREEAIQNDLGQNSPSASPRYVASKKGRVYYFTWCNGAKNILAENRVYFESAQDARAVGLSPSAACPGLD